MYRFNGNFPDDFKNVLTDLHYSLRCDRQDLLVTAIKHFRTLPAEQQDELVSQYLIEKRKLR